mmetsp:Transcript_19003/g.47557  ORF Transcript_19003/g.47557 Transcript_19003/m.47557 type:complete len:238 (+) Transcript_19003:355-1068(+)
MAVALAESPSVRINVQSAEFAVPAMFASSSLGMISLVADLVEILARLASSACCFAFAHLSMLSTTPHLSTSCTVSSDSLQAVPKSRGRLVMSSFVCELKVGFSMKVFMNRNKCDLMFGREIRKVPLYSSVAFSQILSTSGPSTWFTCVPPFVVAIEFTKETCWKPPFSLIPMYTSHRLLGRGLFSTGSSHSGGSTTSARISGAARCHSPTYSRNVRIGSSFPLSQTETCSGVQPARS